MARLMILTPYPGVLSNDITSYTPTDGLEKLAQQLIPRVTHKFEQLHIQSYVNTPDNPSLPGVTSISHVEPTTDGMEQLKAAAEALGITHLLLIGDARLLLTVASAELIYDRSERPITYAWCCLPNPFVTYAELEVANYFDFLVFTSDMERGGFSDGIAGLGGGIPKHAFRTTLDARVIRPGVDTSVFYPIEAGTKEYGPEEVRQVLFDGKVSGSDFLVTMCGRNHAFSGIPRAMAMVEYLRRLTKRSVKLYLHMPRSGYYDLAGLATGNELVINTDVFIGEKFFGPGGQPLATPAQMNFIYNASSLVLCMEERSPWPISLLEAQAAAVPTAGPEDHVWLDAIYERGILLPTTLDVVGGEYRRVCDPLGSAQAIEEYLRSSEKWEAVRERQVAHARSSHASWDRMATEWLHLFGFD